jgi:hypothetical protein
VLEDDVDALNSSRSSSEDVFVQYAERLLQEFLSGLVSIAND